MYIAVLCTRGTKKKRTFNYFVQQKEIICVSAGAIHARIRQIFQILISVTYLEEEETERRLTNNKKVNKTNYVDHTME